MPSLGARGARLLARATIRVPTALTLHRRNFVRVYRATLEQMAISFGRVPRECTRATVDAGDIRGEWIVPNAATQRTIFYLHGGGYIGGAPRQYRSLTSALALACGARVFALDYRLAPEHPFPAALEDALAAYRWLLAQDTRPEEVVVGGDSAGGGLTLSFLLAARDRGLPLPAGGILLSPWVDLAGTGSSAQTNAASDDVVISDPTHTIAKLYAGSVALDDPLASGLYGELRGLPPLLVQASTIEVLRDDAVRLVEKARAAGVDATLHLWDGVPHVWHVFTKVPESREAYAEIAAFVARVSSRHQEDPSCPV